jgi:hypothetical protein
MKKTALLIFIVVCLFLTSCYNDTRFYEKNVIIYNFDNSGQYIYYVDDNSDDNSVLSKRIIDTELYSYISDIIYDNKIIIADIVSHYRNNDDLNNREVLDIKVKKILDKK